MRYQIDDTFVDTKLATERYDESKHWNGNNMISDATGSQWEHETLYRSKRSRYYIVHTSQWQGSEPSAQFVEDRDAAAWLMRNNSELPANLAKYEDELSE